MLLIFAWRTRFCRKRKRWETPLSFGIWLWSHMHSCDFLFFFFFFFNRFLYIFFFMDAVRLLLLLWDWTLLHATQHTLTLRVPHAFCLPCVRHFRCRHICATFIRVAQFTFKYSTKLAASNFSVTQSKEDNYFPRYSKWIGLYSQQ